MSAEQLKNVAAQRLTSVLLLYGVCSQIIQSVSMYAGAGLH